MGYYSTMDYCQFKSEFNKKELDAKIQEFLSKTDEQDYNFFYEFELFSEKSQEGLYTYEVVPQGGDYYTKHYSESPLAQIISTLIAPWEKTTLEFVGEDGATWGWAIESGKVFKLEYKTFVKISKEEIISINEWIRRNDNGK